MNLIAYNQDYMIKYDGRWYKGYYCPSMNKFIVNNTFLIKFMVAEEVIKYRWWLRWLL